MEKNPVESVHIHNFSRLILTSKPLAKATIRGNSANPRLGGAAYFYPADAGTLVLAEVMGLPRRVPGANDKAGPFYAFHIHEGKECGDPGGANPFMAAGSHYNPQGKEHPEHAGDMPQLLADKGYAYTSFYTGRFKPEDIIGRTVVIHQHSDDFHTQPSGNAGMKIACGVVEAVMGES